LAWSFAHLDIQNIPLMDAISAAAIKRITEFSASELLNMSLALEHLGVSDTPLRDAIAAQSRPIGLDISASLSSLPPHRSA